MSTVTCDRGCAVTSKLTVTGKVAKALGLVRRAGTPVVVAAATGKRTSAGGVRLVLHPTRAARRALGRVTKLTLSQVTTVTGAAVPTTAVVRARRVQLTTPRRR